MFRIEIETKNDAFAEDNLSREISRILYEFNSKLNYEYNLSNFVSVKFPLLDENGNRVGYASYERD